MKYSLIILGGHDDNYKVDFWVALDAETIKKEIKRLKKEGYVLVKQFGDEEREMIVYPHFPQKPVCKNMGDFVDWFDD